MPESNTTTQENPKDKEIHHSKAELLKSLLNDQLIEIKSASLFEFLKFIEMQYPDLSFAFKMKNGITKLKKITH